MARQFRNITITVRDDQYKKLREMEEVNISGLVRKLLDAYFQGKLQPGTDPRYATDFRQIGGGGKHP